MIRTTLARIRVRRLCRDKTRGEVLAGPLVIRCALGRSGPARTKREGDGITPCGAFRMRAAFYRADRLPRPSSGLGLRRTKPEDGWCDDAGDRRYNRPLRLPAPGVGAEAMWRADGLYDLVVDLDYNRGPIRRGRGSAIFLHAAREGFGATEGCVALRRADLVRLLRRVGPRTRLVVG
ncbi:L,D-transpeptidase family protein [Methylobacterium sp. sgz302541]|uniref:L,D-transpeptidase family protein n=1 Tax=unclassified Methylobacterium TaxID=2615210 RepID=UPI003D32AEF2